MKGRMLKRLAVVLLLSLACTTNIWGASRYGTEFTYQPYYGTPGHRGEDAVGKMHTNDDGSPRAFYKEGESRQMKKAWLGMDVYHQGTFYGSYWYYLGADGYVSRGTKEIDGVVYKFADDGRMLVNETGFYKEQKYQFGEDGKGVLIEMTPLERMGHSKVIKWMRGTYAIYTADVEAARMLGANYNEKELLVRDWGIGDRDSGIAMVERLVANARSISEKDQKAWNYSRAMMLCQTFQNVEFITQEERYAKQLEIAPEIQANFTSWDDFNTHYMNGFREWAYSADRADSVRRREAMYEYQKQRSDSPFLLDWNLKLEKDW